MRLPNSSDRIALTNDAAGLVTWLDVLATAI
jgi:hypothetical protein